MKSVNPSEQRTGVNVQILLTNDDGIYAPGLAAMEKVLARLGDVTVVAPAIEQSGVGHSITFLSPLMAAEAFDGERRRGWAVEGSPADCVKLAIGRFCPRRPDLIVSGINGGFNIGINVLYSGTVAGATEGALFGIPSVAVSLEYDERPKFDKAAELAVGSDRADRRSSRTRDPSRCTISTSRRRRSSGRRRSAWCRWRRPAGRPTSMSGSTRRAGATTGRWARRRPQSLASSPTWKRFDKVT